MLTNKDPRALSSVSFKSKLVSKVWWPLTGYQLIIECLYLAQGIRESDSW